MKRLLGNLMVLVLASMVGLAHADAQSHYKAAEKFYDATNVVDAPTITERMVSAMVSQSPELVPHKSILLDFMLEIINSDEYRDLKIQSYMAHLSEPQLNELTGIFSSDAYQQFRMRQAAMLTESNQGIQQLMRARQGELTRRIQENVQRLAQ